MGGVKRTWYPYPAPYLLECHVRNVGVKSQRAEIRRAVAEHSARTAIRGGIDLVPQPRIELTLLDVRSLTVVKAAEIFVR